MIYATVIIHLNVLLLVPGKEQVILNMGYRFRDTWDVHVVFHNIYQKISCAFKHLNQSARAHKVLNPMILS